MRQWEKRLDPAHLRLGQQEQISHGERLLAPPLNQPII
jgi:hypothetical protein